MLKLDGIREDSWSPFFTKGTLEPHRLSLYKSFRNEAKKASEHAFSLAKSKENFDLWSMAASSVVDQLVSLATLEIGWILDDKPSSPVENLKKMLEKMQTSLREQVCLDTFMKAHSHHHPFSSPPPTTTSALSLFMEPIPTPSLKPKASV